MVRLVAPAKVSITGSIRVNMSCRDSLLIASAGIPARGHIGLKEAQHQSLRKAFPGTDIDEMEKQFIEWNAGQGATPDNYVGALYGFIKQKLQRAG
jgi:hypothetical protein